VCWRSARPTTSSAVRGRVKVTGSSSGSSGDDGPAALPVQPECPDAPNGRSATTGVTRRAGWPGRRPICSGSTAS
jgi:hypothetical protein